MLDFLVEEEINVERWKYPRLEESEKYQRYRGLNMDMLKRIKVWELLCGVKSYSEIEEVRDWIEKMQEIDQRKFGTQVVSLDVENVKTTFYDTLRMAGSISIDPKNAVLKWRYDHDQISGYSKDVWKQIPGKIMFGNGVS